MRARGLVFLLTGVAWALAATPASATTHAVGQDTPGEPAAARLQAMATVTEHVDAVRQARRAESEAAGPGHAPAARDIAMEGRPSVIEALDEAGREAPGDAWIAGHRVGMRIKQGEPEAALEVARDCAAVGWWCAALEGLALHVLDRIPRAEAAFDRSLAEMPESVRCHWTDEVAELLEGEAAAEYRRLGCIGRQAMMERVWWLADPLHLRPGNDRKTEHFARLVALQLHEQALDLVGLACVPAHRRSWLVLGVPSEEWWGFEEPSEPFDERPGERVVPGAHVITAPHRSSATDWELRTEQGSERHQAAYLPLRPIEQQTALFRRGDSLAVRIAVPEEAMPGAAPARPGYLYVRRPSDPRPPAAPAEPDGPIEVESGVVLSRSAGDPPVILREPARTMSASAPGDLVFAGTVPGIDPVLISIEAFPSREEAPGLAARARLARGLPATGVHTAEDAVGLSDLLIFEAGAQEAEALLEEVTPRMLSSLRVPAGTEIAMYWEAYDVTADRPLDLALRGLPGESSFFRRLAERLRLVSPRDGIEVRWTEVPDADGRMSRVLNLDLSAWEPAEYTLELHLEATGREPVVARRTIVVVEM